MDSQPDGPATGPRETDTCETGTRELDLTAWPLFGLRLHCRDVTLRLVRESDLARLAAIVPDDWEENPHSERFAGLDAAQNRLRLRYQDYWRALGTWSPASWQLPMAVEYSGTMVGVQQLEADNFPVLRTVDSGSWLIPEVRGRGVGVAMRMAVLGLAFDHLAALAAVTSADLDNRASLGVSRRIGYAGNGTGLVDSGKGPIELQYLRLTAARWQEAGHGREVTVTGFEPCRPWFGVSLPGS